MIFKYLLAVSLLSTALAYVPLYSQCGGIAYFGDNSCITGSRCSYINDYYSQCLPVPDTGVALWGQCGGIGYSGATTCTSGATCVYVNDYYYQCQSSSNLVVTTTISAPPTTTTASTTTTAIKNLVPLWGQCGGQGFTGPTQCSDGLSCVFVNTWYSQCQPNGASSSTTVTSTQTASTISTITGSPNGNVSTDFPGCKFRNGRDYDQPTTDYSQYDYITIWINTPASDGTGTNFNPWYQGAMINACKANGKIPVFYAYIIAFEARYRADLQDCDVRPYNNLCTNGADFIRKNRDLIVSRYRHQATSIATALGDKNAVAVFLIEPDFWQYYGDPNQIGGGLSGDYMRKLLDDCVAEIKSALPNAKISWDISAWIGVSGMTTWWSFFKDAPYIDFVNTSGGQSHGESLEIKPNELKWADVNKITGKRIIADCGYGVAGGASDNCSPWFTSSNINARVSDGVIALTEAYAKQALTNKPALC